MNLILIFASMLKFKSFKAKVGGVKMIDMSCRISHSSWRSVPWLKWLDLRITTFPKKKLLSEPLRNDAHELVREFDLQWTRELWVRFPFISKTVFQAKSLIVYSFSCLIKLNFVRKKAIARHASKAVMLKMFVQFRFKIT